MATIYVRPARNGEAKDFLNWSIGQEGFDAEVAARPDTFTIAAYDKQKVIAYMPFHQPIMLETIAFNPEATELEKVSAMKELIQFVVAQCHLRGVSEIYFLGSDKSTNEFAQNHIFERVDYPVYRVKISDLEPRREG